MSNMHTIFLLSMTCVAGQANEVPLSPHFIAKLLRRFLLRDKKGKGKLRYREILSHVLIDTEFWAMGDKSRLDALASIDGDSDGFLTPTETVLAQFMISTTIAYEPTRQLEKRSTVHGDSSEMRVALDDVFGLLQLRSVVMLRSRLERSGKMVLLSDYELVQEMDERWDQIRDQQEREYNEALQHQKDREAKETEDLSRLSPVAAWAKVHSVVAIGSKLLRKGPAAIRTESPTDGTTPPPASTASLQSRAVLPRRMSAAYLGDSPDGGRPNEIAGAQSPHNKLSSLIRRNLVSGPRVPSPTHARDPALVADVLTSTVKSVRRRRLKSAEAVLDSTPLEAAGRLASFLNREPSGIPSSPPRAAAAAVTAAANSPGERSESPMTSRSVPLEEGGGEAVTDERSFSSSILNEKELDEYIGSECDALEKELKKIFAFYCQKTEKKEDEPLIGHAGFRGLVSDCARFEVENVPIIRVDETFMFACGWEEAVPKSVEELKEEATGTPRVPQIPLGMTYSQFRNRAIPRLAKLLMPTPPEEFIGQRRDFNRVATFCRFILLPNCARHKPDPLLHAFYVDDVLAQIKLYRGVLQSIFAHYASLDLYLVAWDKMDPELHHRSWGPGNGKLSITEKEFLTLLDNFGIIGMRSRLQSRNVIFSKTMGLHIMECAKRGPEGRPATDTMVFSEFIEALLRIAVILFPLQGMKYEELEAGPISLFTDSDHDAARLGPLRNLVPNKWNMHDTRLHRRSTSSLGQSSSRTPSPSLALTNLGAFKFDRSQSVEAATTAAFSQPSQASAAPLRPVQSLRPSTIPESTFHREALQREASSYYRTMQMPLSASEQSRSTPLATMSRFGEPASSSAAEKEELLASIDFSPFSKGLLHERRVAKLRGISPLTITSDLEHRLPRTLQHSRSLSSLPASSPLFTPQAPVPLGARSLPRSLPSPPAVEGTRSNTQSQVRFSAMSSTVGGTQTRDRSQLSVEELMEERLLLLSQGNLAKVNHHMKRSPKPGSSKSLVHKTSDGPVLVRLARDVFQPWQRNF